MNDEVVVATTSTGNVGAPIPGWQPDFYTPFAKLLHSLGATDARGVLDFLDTLWSIYAVFAYLAAALFVYGYVYASVRKSQLEEVLVEGVQMQEQMYLRSQGADVKNERWQELMGHLESDNPNDWKLAIIEADVMLDDAIKERGYAGDTLGERLRSVSPTQMQTLDDAWDAHKIRNEIAHGGADFVLTHKIARDTITRYQRVFEELGVN